MCKNPVLVHVNVIGNQYLMKLIFLSQELIHIFQGCSQEFCQNHEAAKQATKCYRHMLQIVLMIRLGKKILNLQIICYNGTKICNLFTANQVNTSLLMRPQLTNNKKLRLLAFFAHISLVVHTVHNFTLCLGASLPFIFGLFLNSCPICFLSFSFFSCNLIPCSGCSALHGVNHY